MAMAVAELMALKEQLSARQRKSESDKYTPVKRSLAQTIRTLRHCLSNIDEIPPLNDDLRTKLRAAVTDSYERTTSKRARYRPPNPDKKPLGDPKIRRLTRDEKQNLKVAQKTAA
jgi:hypothetical protein